ncbi:hypothetical protein LTR84_008541 [Exophiala bonariae]|uniref:NADP-dependent oxidoreductase domain-containing protein n=1 Tax=Exophiala bonariae TaxID=1690606 RepID=A0AAV9MWL6_9EURO|nr:hypothetical protein LTR84_008541 [Exophiala bonariae]
MAPDGKQKLQIIFGCGFIGDKDTTYGVKLNTLEQLQPLLDAFRAHGHTTIDTARGYPITNPGGSETLLGSSDLSWAQLDTKVISTPGAHAPDQIAASIADSLKALQIPQLNTIYLHFPDRSVPFSQTVPAIASAVLNSQARRWAISNYSAAEVDEIVSICKSQSLPLPHCYQGHYNALTRHAESRLLPTLRKHGIAFYAYSPGAGGSFGAPPSPTSTTTAATRDDSTAGGSRILLDNPVGAIMREFYGNDAQQRAIARVRALAEKHDIASGHEVALRWVQHHSALDASKGDGMTVAASSVAQLEKTLTGLERGPLPEEVVRAMEEAWEASKETAPDYSPFLEERKWGGEVRE